MTLALTCQGAAKPTDPPPNEDLPFIVPTASPVAAPRHTTLTPLVLDERAISRLLESLLDRGGLTISDCARRMGVTAQCIRQYVHGRRSPGIVMLLKIAETCGARVLVEFPR